MTTGLDPLFTMVYIRSFTGKVDKVNFLHIFFKRVSIVIAAVTPCTMFRNHFREQLSIADYQIL